VPLNNRKTTHHGEENRRTPDNYPAALQGARNRSFRPPEYFWLTRAAGFGLVTASRSIGVGFMDSTTVLLGAGQLILAMAVGYVAWLARRDARRSSLSALITLLSDLRNRNDFAIADLSNQMASDDFRRSSAEIRAGMIDSDHRLHAIEAEITEAMLHTLRQCDKEWGFAGRLHEAFRAEASFEKDWHQRLPHSTHSAR
jgi:hypothetical protein